MKNQAISGDLGILHKDISKLQDFFREAYDLDYYFQYLGNDWYLVQCYEIKLEASIYAKDINILRINIEKYLGDYLNEH